MTQRNSGEGFTRTFILPALWMFLIPTLSFAFFRFAESKFDFDIRADMLRDVEREADLTEAERQLFIETIESISFSELLMDENFAHQVDSTTRNYYASFRWMIRLSLACIFTGLGVVAFGGICLLLSLRSQEAQYAGLSAGWHVLRIVSTFQVIAQGILLVALAFWIPGLIIKRYFVRIIAVAAVLALGAIAAVVKGIFFSPTTRFDLAGKTVPRSESPEFWDRIESISEQVGTAPPDEVIVGIDDNFFVTENPVTLNGATRRGGFSLPACRCCGNWTATKRRL